jgi:hypothetical protein
VEEATILHRLHVCGILRASPANAPSSMVVLKTKSKKKNNRINKRIKTFIAHQPDCGEVTCGQRRDRRPQG